MFDTLDISGSGLLAQRVRLDTIAGNLANLNTTRDASGQLNPYRRRFVVFAPGQPGQPGAPGVHVQAVEQDPSAFRKVLKPGDPEAGPDGYIRYPNIDMTTEMVNAMEASRAYEANVTTMEVTKSMISSALRLIA
jgi:flagellar basal-body rod protein FlgC